MYIWLDLLNFTYCSESIIMSEIFHMNRVPGHSGKEKKWRLERNGFWEFDQQVTDNLLLPKPVLSISGETTGCKTLGLARSNVWILPC